MHFEDYEELPTPSVSINMTAGAMAGVLEHCVMYPMDSIKTRMQSLSPLSTGQTILSTFNNMIKHEGLTRPIRGMTAVVAGAGPAHAFYFATYEYTKEVMVKIAPQHHQINYIISAVTATLIHDAISNPTEVIKQRLQMYGSRYKSVIQCTRGVYQNEGLRAFYRSYSTQLVMNLPHQALHFSTYEFFQNTLNKDRRYNPPVHVLAGGAAGAVAAAVTTPLDVIKTLLNTQETGIGLTKGMREAISQIYKVAGPLGFFRGLTARVLYSMPATAICWSTYEFFKYVLSSKSREDYKSSVSGKSALQPKDILHVSSATAATGTGIPSTITSTTSVTTTPPPPPTTTNTMTGITSTSASVDDHRSFSTAGLRRYVLPTATYNNVPENDTDVTVTIMKPSRENAISSSSLVNATSTTSTSSSAASVYPTATISLTTIHAAETGRTFDRSCNT